MKTTLPILLTVIFTALLLGVGAIAGKLNIVVSRHPLINQQFKYQMGALWVSVLALGMAYAMSKPGLHGYFSLGKVTAPAQEWKWFGIAEGDSWLKTGLSLSLVITLVTGLFLFFQTKGAQVDWKLLQAIIPWVILFAITNSFAEEMIFRVGLLAPLSGKVNPNTLFLISAVLFGLAHFRGIPGGILGMGLAGILGYVLAKSVYETQGFFWAWWIHFLQDILILASLFAMAGAKR